MFLIFQLTTQFKCHVTFWVGHPHPDSTPKQVLGAMGLVNKEIKRSNLSRDDVIDVSRDFMGGVSSS